MQVKESADAAASPRNNSDSTEKIFWIAFIISIFLIVVGFFIPPRGVIDGSVITSTGILSAFVELHHLIEKGIKIERKQKDNANE